MNARDIMCFPVQTCRASDSMDCAAQLMWEHDCGSVPVVDDEGCVLGVITDRDICMAAYTQGRPLAEMPVQSAMSQQVHACSMLDALDLVQALMREHRVRRVPVLDDRQHLVGIISLNDIALAAADGVGRAGAPVSSEDVVVLLGAVCEPRTPRGKPDGGAGAAANADGAAGEESQERGGPGRHARSAASAPQRKTSGSGRSS